MRMLCQCALLLFDFFFVQICCISFFFFFCGIFLNFFLSISFFHVHATMYEWTGHNQFRGKTFRDILWHYPLYYYCGVRTTTNEQPELAAMLVREKSFNHIGTINTLIWNGVKTVTPQIYCRWKVFWNLLLFRKK